MQPTKAYAQKIFHLLKVHYPDAKMILRWSDNFELLTAVILSAQCTDKKVNEVTTVLFPKYKKYRNECRSFYEHYQQNIKLPKDELIELVNFAFVPIEELERDIKSTGFYKAKAKSVRGAAKKVLDVFHGILPKSITELTAIPGVGRKTANVFLGNAYHISEGIAVDTHVKKQAKLLGLTSNTEPDKIEQDLMKLFPKEQWFPLTYLLIEHGRNMRRKKEDRVSCKISDCLLCNAEEK
ncbi:MAG TPA: endonuclease III [Patescibacteria group bacterium]|nr:endonuclease III [Patescibacteria group bacterium]